MKRRALLLALWLVLVLITPARLLWWGWLCLAGHPRAWKHAIAEDQAWNALTGGSEDETISSRAGKARRVGRRWGCILCRVLDWIDAGHCDRSIERDEGKPLELDPRQAGLNPPTK